MTTSSTKFDLFQKYFIVLSFIGSFLIFLIPILFLNSTLEFISIISLIASLTAALTLLYSIRAEKFTYIFWLINSLSYSYLAYVDKYYGQIFVNICICIPIVIYGYFHWGKHTKENSKTIEIRSLSLKLWIYTALATLAILIFFMIVLNNLPYILKHLFNLQVNKDNNLIFDSISTTLSIMATYLTAKRYIQQWIFWIVTDTISVILFISGIFIHHTSLISSLSGAFMWIEYGSGSIYGLIYWLKLYKKRF
ncbi:MAG: nicotinamide riboside transporter PnuC [Psittacicella sp.]